MGLTLERPTESWTSTERVFVPKVDAHRDRSSQTEGPVMYQPLVYMDKSKEHTVHILKILCKWFQTFFVKVGVALSKAATKFCSPFMEAEEKV